MQEKLSDKQVKRLIELDKKHTESVRKNKLRYPKPEEFETISDEELAKRGFSGKVS